MKTTKKISIISLALALFLCLSNLFTVSASASQIYDLNEETVSKSFYLSNGNYKEFNCYPYTSRSGDSSIYLKLYNWNNNVIRIVFANETDQEIIETRTTSDSQIKIVWDGLRSNREYSIRICNESSFTGDFDLSIS